MFLLFLLETRPACDRQGSLPLTSASSSGLQPPIIRDEYEGSGTVHESGGSDATQSGLTEGELVNPRDVLIEYAIAVSRLAIGYLCTVFRHMYVAVKC